MTSSSHLAEWNAERQNSSCLQTRQAVHSPHVHAPPCAGQHWISHVGKQLREKLTWPRPCSRMAFWKMLSASPVSIMRSTSSADAFWPVTVYTRRSTTSLHQPDICCFYNPPTPPPQYATIKSQLQGPRKQIASTLLGREIPCGCIGALSMCSFH